VRDPLAGRTKRRSDFLTAHLARELLAMLSGHPVTTRGTDVEPLVRFDEVDPTFASRRAGEAQLEETYRHVNSDGCVCLKAH